MPFTPACSGERWTPKALLSAVGLVLASCHPVSEASLARPTAAEASPSSAAAPAPESETRDDDLGPASAAHDDEAEEASELLADDAEAPEAEAEATIRPHPLDGWSAEQIEVAVRDDLASLGSISVGSPSAGALINGVQAEAGALYQVVDAAGAWGTAETVEQLERAIRAVHERFSDTPPLYLGHISAQKGGHLKPHVSHQSGRDVDLSFYYKEGARWYARARAENLDVARTWALVRALITDTDVEMILLDTSVQRLLEEHARSVGEAPSWLDSVFRGGPGKPALIRYAPGHATHLHIRFYNPQAQETFRRTAQALSEQGLVPKLVAHARHRARRGDTLGKLARQYRSSVAAIKAANGLRSSLIREGRTYRIPIPSRPARTTAPLRFPPRRVPPRAAEPVSRAEASP